MLSIGALTSACTFLIQLVWSAISPVRTLLLTCEGKQFSKYFWMTQPKQYTVEPQKHELLRETQNSLSKQVIWVIRVQVIEVLSPPRITFDLDNNRFPLCKVSAGNQNFRPPFTLALPFTGHYYLWLMPPDEISLVSYMSLLFKCYKRILCMQVKALKMTAAQTAVSSWHKVPLFVYSYFEKGVRKSHATIPKGGWFWVRCSSRKFERMAWEAMDLHVCLPMLKESNKSRFDSFGVRDSALIISHITFRDCPVQVFCDNLSRNSVYKWHFPGSHLLQV